MKLVNLTPNPVDIYDDNDTLLISVPVSGTIAHCPIKPSGTISIDGVDVSSKYFGKIENLPEPDGKTLYIVNTLVATAAWVQGRTDVVCQPKPKLDEHGKAIGTYGLAVRL